MAIFNSYVKLPEGISNVKVSTPSLLPGCVVGALPISCSRCSKSCSFGAKALAAGGMVGFQNQLHAKIVLAAWGCGTRGCPKTGENNGWGYHGNIMGSVAICKTTWGFVQPWRIQKSKGKSRVPFWHGRRIDHQTAKESQCIIPTRQMSWFFQLQQSVPLGGIIMPQ